MITSYPDKNSLKEVLSSELSISAIKNICRRSGIFLLSNNKSDVINTAHLYYWGFEDINKLSDLMDDCKNYKRSFRLAIDKSSSSVSEDENTTFKDFLALVSTYRTGIAVQRGITFESFVIDNTHSHSHLRAAIEYKKKRRGRVKLLDQVTQRFTFDAFEDNDKIIVDIVFDDRADVQIAKSIITDSMATSDEFNMPKQISLRSLTTAERVDLFDRFFVYSLINWKIDAVKNIKVEMSEDIISEEDEEEAVENDFLTGIQSALLSGSGLRTNPIVVDAVNKGYYFPKATVLLEHRTEAIKLLLDINFSGDDLVLELSVISTYEIAEDRLYKRPIAIEDQEAALQYFHSTISTIYYDIVDERDAKTTS